MNSSRCFHSFQFLSRPIEDIIIISKFASFPSDSGELRFRPITWRAVLELGSLLSRRTIACNRNRMDGSSRARTQESDTEDDYENIVICAIDKRGHTFGCSVYNEIERKLSLMEDAVSPGVDLIKSGKIAYFYIFSSEAEGNN